MHCVKLLIPQHIYVQFGLNPNQILMLSNFPSGCEPEAPKTIDGVSIYFEETSSRIQGPLLLKVAKTIKIEQVDNDSHSINFEDGSVQCLGPTQSESDTNIKTEDEDACDTTSIDSEEISSPHCEQSQPVINKKTEYDIRSINAEDEVNDSFSAFSKDEMYNSISSSEQASSPSLPLHLITDVRTENKDANELSLEKSYREVPIGAVNVENGKHLIMAYKVNPISNLPYSCYDPRSSSNHCEEIGTSTRRWKLVICDSPVLESQNTHDCEISINSPNTSPEMPACNEHQSQSGGMGTTTKKSKPLVSVSPIVEKAKSTKTQNYDRPNIFGAIPAFNEHSSTSNQFDGTVTSPRKWKLVLCNSPSLQNPRSQNTRDCSSPFNTTSSTSKEDSHFEPSVDDLDTSPEDDAVVHPWSCEHCIRQFPDEAALNCHLIHCEGNATQGNRVEYPRTCTSCKRTYTTRSLFWRHKKLCTPSSEKEVKIAHPRLGTNRKKHNSSSPNHKKMLDGVKPQTKVKSIYPRICPTCHNFYTNKGSFYTHKNTCFEPKSRNLRSAAQHSSADVVETNAQSDGPSCSTPGEDRSVKVWGKPGEYIPTTLGSKRGVKYFVVKKT